MSKDNAMLMVTRERPSDRRYGLGKSLVPLVGELEKLGLEVGYVSQADLGAGSQNFMMGFQRLLLRLLGWGLISQDSLSLAYGLMERVNMGRLAAKLAAQQQVAFVHCHDPVIAWGFKLFARLRGVTGVRWGLSEHGFGSYMQAFHEDGALLASRRMRILRRWEARILRQADWVLTPTQACRAQLARDLSVYPIPSHWRVIPHLLPAVASYPRHEARAMLGWETGALYIIAVGRLAPLKNFPALLRACASLADPEVRLVILGDGDRSSLHSLAVELGFDSRLGFAATDDMGVYYSAADLYVSTSTTESFGLANLEALAAGLACVCTAVGGVPDVVGHGAYLIPAEDPEALRQALRELIADPGLRARLSRRGLDRVAHWPAPALLAQRYLAAYQGEPVTPGHQALTSPRGSETFWSAFAAGIEHCPLPGELPLPSDSTILVFAPHPDDEVLACGGTLALLKKLHCHVTVAIVTDGAMGDPLGYYDEDIVNLRAGESKAGLALLGVDDIRFLGYPDGGFKATGAAKDRFIQLLEEVQPTWIFLPSPLDFHRDHVNVALAALEAWLAWGGRNRLFFWELWQPLPATAVVKIDAVFDLKQQSARCYRLPHRYCDYLGISSQLTGYRSLYIKDSRQAEAFMEISCRHAESVIDNLLGLRAYQEYALTKGLDSPGPSRV